MIEEYSLLVCTDSYVGNFEREMCAFMTGSIGDCGVGEEYSDLFHTFICNKIGRKWGGNGDDLMMGLTDWRADSDDSAPCARPVGIYTNDPKTVEIYLERVPNEQELEILKERAYAFSEVYCKTREWHKPIQVLGFKLLTKIIQHNIMVL